MLERGEIAFDRFEIERAVGAGAMGDVYRATDRRTAQPVALKVLRKASHSDRFAREARLLAELSHPAIVGYVDHGEAEDGARYLAMEWLDGQTLEDRLCTRPLLVAETTRIGRQIAEALSAAHGSGVVHRDVKPSNVFLTGGGDGVRVKLIDFGVARANVRDRHRTATGVIIGTLSYMAPEQARGDRDVDWRADLFGLGCVLYECLTGRAPFVGLTAIEVRLAVLSAEPLRLRMARPDLPLDFDLLVHMMLSKEPSGRFLEAKRIAKTLGELERIDAPAPKPSPAFGDATRLVEGGAERSEDDTDDDATEADSHRLGT